MKKKHMIVIFIIVVLFLMSYLSIVGFQTASTDKSIYSVGEEVKIHWSDFSLEWCSCSDKKIQIFKEETTGWKKISYQLYGFGGACVNGEIVGLPMHCDIVSCSFPILSLKDGNFTWDSKFYESKGTVDSCLDKYSNEIINITMRDYELKNVSIGKYKIKFGSAEKTIEIK